MDTERFDRLAKMCSTPDTRRALLRVLAALPLAGGLLPLHGEGAAGQGNGAIVGGGRRRRRRKARHDPGDDKDNRKGKRNKNKKKGKGNGQTPQPGPAGQPSCGAGTCAAGQVCEGGACQPCGDVCPSGCPYTSVQAALDDPAGPSTIHLCRGTYVGNLRITRDVTVIGAGDGDDPAIDTILQGTDGDAVVRNQHETEGPTVTLERLRITGGTGATIGGVVNHGILTLTDSTVAGNTSSGIGGIFTGRDRTLTLIRSTVTGNKAVPMGTDNAIGGGICNIGSTVTLIDSQITGNTAAFGGGIFNQDTSVTLTNSTVTGNTARRSGGGILNVTDGSVMLTGGSLVCGNTAPTAPQCGGFSDPACQATCPP